MTRRTSPMEIFIPPGVEFDRLVDAFAEGAVQQMLKAIWGGYGLLLEDFLSKFIIGPTDEGIERAITQLLWKRIDQCLTHEEPYYIIHGPFEYETRALAPACPPQYDLAFVLHSNERIMWPLEAKVIKDPERITEYINEIRNNFLTGRYAPFTNGGAMLGYLLSGLSNDVLFSVEKSFNQVAKSIKAQPPNNLEFQSLHQRVLANPTHCSGQFTCHHLIMAIVPVSTTGCLSTEREQVDPEE